MYGQIKIVNYMVQLDLRNIMVKRHIYDQLNCIILLSIHCIDNEINRVCAKMTTCAIVLSQLNSALYFIAQVYLIAQLINRLWGPPI